MGLFRRKKQPFAAPPEHAVIVRFSLSDDAFGRPEEREAFFAFEETLMAAIERAGVGEYDGNEIGGGEAVIYAYGPDADELFTTMEPHLRGFDARPASCVLRYGRASDPDVRERRVAL